jgi:hypothetical protein
MATMIIGLGGTGCQIAGHVYDLFGSTLPSDVAIIAIDTKLHIDPTPRKKTDLEHHGHFFSLGAGIAPQMAFQEALQMPGFKEWWGEMENKEIYPMALPDFTAGAGQVRLNGRLAYWFGAGQIVTALNRAMTQLGNATRISGLDIFLACSSTNGTGSSIFVDAAFLVKDYIQKNFAATPRIFGIVFDPSIATNHGRERGTADVIAKANARNLYLETDYWRHHGGKKPYSLTFPDRTTLKCNFSPHDFCFVLCNTNQDDANLGSWNAYIEMAAAAIKSFADPAIQATILNPLIVMALARYPNDLLMGRSCQYGSFGYSVFQFPREKILTYCAYRLASDIMERLKCQCNKESLRQKADGFFVLNKIVEVNPKNDLFDFCKSQSTLSQYIRNIEMGGQVDNANDVRAQESSLDAMLEKYRKAVAAALPHKLTEVEAALKAQLIGSFIDRGDLASASVYVEGLIKLCEEQMAAVKEDLTKLDKEKRKKDLNFALDVLEKKTIFSFLGIGRKNAIVQVIGLLKGLYDENERDINTHAIMDFYQRLQNTLCAWRRAIDNFIINVKRQIEDPIDESLKSLLKKEIDLGKVSGERTKLYSSSVDVGAWEAFVEETFYGPAVNQNFLPQQDSIIAGFAQQKPSGLTGKTEELFKRELEESGWAANHPHEIEAWCTEMKKGLIDICRQYFAGTEVTRLTLEQVLRKESDFVLRPYLDACSKKDVVAAEKIKTEALNGIYGRQNVDLFGQYLTQYDVLMDMVMKARLGSLDARTTPFWTIGPERPFITTLKQSQFWTCNSQANPKIWALLRIMAPEATLTDLTEDDRIEVFRVEHHAPLNQVKTVQQLAATSSDYCNFTPCYSDKRYLTEWKETFWTSEDIRYIWFALGEACQYITAGGDEKIHANFRFGEHGRIIRTLPNAIEALADKETLDALKNEVIPFLDKFNHVDKIDEVRKAMTLGAAFYDVQFKKYNNHYLGKTYDALYKAVKTFMKNKGLKLWQGEMQVEAMEAIDDSPVSDPS